MKRNNTRRFSAAFMLPLLLLGIGCDREDGALVAVDRPVVSEGAFRIRFTSAQAAERAAASEGTFEAAGIIDDAGAYSEVRSSSEPLRRLSSLSGWKTVRGAKGTMLIEFYVGLRATDHNTLAAKGGFGIVQGSGAYTSLQGGGEIDLELDMNASVAELTEVLEGKAAYVQ